MVSGLPTLLCRFLHKDDSSELCGLLVERPPRWQQQQQQPRGRTPPDSARHAETCLPLARTSREANRPPQAHFLFGGRERLVR
jgi:hypothetical protein